MKEFKAGRLSKLLKCLIGGIFLVMNFSSAQWAINAPNEKITDPLRGRIFGEKFVFNKAVYRNGVLQIQSQKAENNFPESEIVIFTKLPEKDLPIEVVPTEKGDYPQIHMKFFKEGWNVPGNLTFASEYSLRLEFVEKTAAKIKLKIHLSLPDYKKSFLIGEFEVEV